MASDKDKTTPDLGEIRQRIDDIDERIQALISERARYAQEVGRSKSDATSAVDYYRPEREADVLRRVEARNEGPLRDEEMLRLFREIMSACLAQQEPLKVGFLGPEGTFTQTAVFKHFGHSVRALPFHTIDEVFQEVESGAADFGVVPIENSTEGSVNNTLRICAHEQSLAQCRGWLREHLPDVELIGMSSNAAGARRARDEEGTAAIGPDVAADVYDLRILVNNIEDRPDNATRFLIIGRELLAASGVDKTTILVSAEDTAAGSGVLFELLKPFAEHGVSLTRIESRPSRRRNWDYVFFCDIEGHAAESPVAEALEELQSKSSLFKVLGAYPKAIN